MSQGRLGAESRLTRGVGLCTARINGGRFRISAGPHSTHQSIFVAASSAYPFISEDDNALYLTHGSFFRPSFRSTARTHPSQCHLEFFPEFQI